MDPKTSMAVNAPPVAPYDDGFSTESEDFNDSEEPTPEPQDAQLHIAASRSSRSAVVVENQSHFRQVIDLSAPNSDNLTKEKKSHKIATPRLKSGENAAKQATIDLTAPKKDQTTARETNGEKTEEHCRSCKGYLTPLTERIKVMKAAALPHTGKGPPPTGQCSCCHITYPVAALTDESRSKPCCYMCNWAKKKVRNKVVGAKRVRNEDAEVTHVDKAGEDVKVTHVDRAAVDEKEGCCRRCKVQLAPLARRLRSMKQVVLHQKRGPPPTKQCSCCHITYPMAAITLKSRLPSCQTPICFLCKPASIEAKTETKIATTTTTTGSVPAVKIPASKLRVNGAVATAKNTAVNMTIAVKSELSVLRGNGAVVTSQKTATNMTSSIAVKSESSMLQGDRTVATAMNTAEEKAPPRSDTVAAGNSVEEKTEVLLETKKTPEIIVVGGGDDDEEGELVEEGTCKCCMGELIPLVRRLQMVKDAALQHGGKGPPPSRQCACCRIKYPSAALTAKSRKMTRVVPICSQCCKAGGSSIYEMLAVSDEFIEAFKVENPAMARLLLKKKESGKIVEAAENQRKRIVKQKQLKKVLPSAITVHTPIQSERLTPVGDPRSPVPLPRSYLPFKCTARKHISAPRNLLGSRDAAASQAIQHSEQTTEMEQAPQQASQQEPQNRRTARWLQQFEIIDGKTTRERRLEARIATQERREVRQEEKKRQRLK